MSVRSRVVAVWRNLFHRDRVDRDLDNELRAAFEQLVDEKVRGGLPWPMPVAPRRSRWAACECVKQQVRDTRAGASVDSLLQDVRYAVRVLMRSPLFTVTAVLALGIGIAGNAVVFSLADAYLIRDQPGISERTGLPKSVASTAAGVNAYEGDGFDTFLYPNYLDYRKRQTVLEDLAAYHVGPIATFGSGRPTAPCACRRDRVGQLLQGARRPDGAGTRLSAGRRAPRESQYRHGDQRPSLADAVRRRPRGHWQGDSPERPSVHHRRRDGAGFHGLHDRLPEPLGSDDGGSER